MKKKTTTVLTSTGISIIFFAALFASCSCVSAEPEKSISKSFAPPKITAPPLIDGKLEKIWKTGAISGFVDLSTGAPAKTPTDVYVMYDDFALYIAFCCHEPNINEMRQQSKKTARDDSIWYNDRVEIFIDTNRDKKSYYQFLINWCGGIQDGIFNSPRYKNLPPFEWDGNWRAAVSVDSDDKWIAEIAIPFSTLGVKPGKDVAIGANFCRGKLAAPGENTCWSCTYAGFHRPDKFGVLEHLNLTPQALAAENLSDKPFLGTNTYKLRINNKTSGKFTGKLLLSIKDHNNVVLKTFSKKIDIAGNADVTEGIEYEWNKPGKFTAEVYAESATVDKPILLSSAILQFHKILHFNDAKPIFYLGEKTPVRGKVFVRKPREYILAAELLKGDQKIMAKKIKLSDFTFAVPLDSKAIKEGAYHLKVSLMRNGRKTAESILPIRIINRF